METEKEFFYSRGYSYFNNRSVVSFGLDELEREINTRIKDYDISAKETESLGEEECIFIIDEVYRVILEKEVWEYKTKEEILDAIERSLRQQINRYFKS